MLGEVGKHQAAPGRAHGRNDRFGDLSLIEAVPSGAGDGAQCPRQARVAEDLTWLWSPPIDGQLLAH